MSIHLRLAAACLFGLLLTDSANAAYDMSGKWLLVSPGGNPDFDRLELVQSDGNLSQVYPASPPTPPWTGSIDETTGAFHVEWDSVGLGCAETWTFDGTVAADGRSLTGTMVWGNMVQDGCASYDVCVMVTTAVTGTRCGNNVLDAWEECDFGDATDGDCCSSACILAAPGASCTSDGNECTADLCNEAGTCEHAATSGTCVDPDGCGTGECASGSCVITQPAAAGTSCDSDDSVCTPDQCDGAGACVTGESISCWPCGSCDPEHGCVRSTDPCHGPAAPCDANIASLVDLRLRTSERTRQNRFRLDFQVDSPSIDVGNPVTSSTSYAVCAYAEDAGVARSVFNAWVAPGGLCAGDDCWRGEDAGGPFRYRDKTKSAGGLFRVVASNWDGFRIRGAGANVSLPAELPTSSDLVATVYAWEDDFFVRRCWTQPVSALRQTAEQFRGVYPAE